MNITLNHCLQGGIKLADIFLNHISEFILIRYEDFFADKMGSISSIASSFQLNQVKDITNILDYQFQPRGNRKVSCEEFFGEKNFNRINHLCGSRMKLLGYRSKQ